MKRIICFIMILVLTFGLAGCKGVAVREEPDTEAVTEEPVTEYYEPETVTENVTIAETAAAPETTTNAVTVTTSTTSNRETAAVTTTRPVVTTTRKQSAGVTVSINCGTILGNMGKLKKGKEYFVPSNGVILADTRVEIKDGDTAFDVLKRVTAEKNIQLEYSYTPAFGSYYVEGINQIYEKDCGSLSGWMFFVNGVESGRGSSDITVKDGDTIQFIYTCDGGDDIS